MKRQAEPGGSFRGGELRLGHLPVGSEESTEPVLWLGGGSAVVSREKYLEIGGFDEIFSPFYVEDVDLSYRAWKRGWPTLFVPRSKVVHKHRGSTGRLDSGYVEQIIARNRLLFVWLNIRDPRMLLQHSLWLLLFCVRLAVAAAKGNTGAKSQLRGVVLAVRKSAVVCRRRRTGDRSSVMTDREIFSLFLPAWDG